MTNFIDDLFKVSKMTNFNYDLIKVSKMTNFNYDLFKGSKMTNFKQCVMEQFVGETFSRHKESKD